MAATVTGLGSGASKSLPASTSWTPITGITPGAGNLLVVWLTINNGAGATSGTWAGNALTNSGLDVLGDSIQRLQMFYLENCPSGSGDVVLIRATNWSGASAAAAIAESVTEIATSSALDKTASGGGASAAPDTASTATTTQDSEILLGAHGTRGPSGDTAVTTNAGDTPDATAAHARVGSTGGGATSNTTLATKYGTQTVAAARQHSWSGMTSRSWAAAIATFLLAATTPQGSGMAALTLGAQGEGRTVRSGSSTVALSLSATGTGTRISSGSGDTALVLSATGVGEAPSMAPREGSGTVALSLAVEGEGRRASAGSSVAPFVLAVQGQGYRLSYGFGTNGLTLSVVGTGPIGGGDLVQTTVKRQGFKWWVLIPGDGFDDVVLSRRNFCWYADTDQGEVEIVRRQFGWWM